MRFILSDNFDGIEIHTHAHAHTHTHISLQHDTDSEQNKQNNNPYLQLWSCFRRPWLFDWFSIITQNTLMDFDKIVDTGRKWYKTH